MFDAEGIPTAQLSEAKNASGSVTGYTRGKSISQAELFGVPCDILIPAARPDCIHAKNAAAIQSRLILQGANIPATAEAEQMLYERGVLVVPDFIANVGGVICAAVEYRGGSEQDAIRAIAEKIRHNTREVLTRSRAEKILPREAAVAMAHERVRQAMALLGRC